MARLQRFLLALALPAGAACDNECEQWRPELVPSTTVVVVDATDVLSLDQREDVWSRIQPLATNAGKESVFHIYEIRDEGDGKRVFRDVGSVSRPCHRCEVNFLFDNPGRRKREWRTRYLEPLERLLSDALGGDASDSSPILEGVRSAARHFDQGRAAAPGGGQPDTAGEGQAGLGHTNRLVLVSDLMQNSDRISFYRDIPRFEHFKSTRIYREVKTRHLKGAEVTVLRLLPPRNISVNEDALVDFWTKHFLSQETEHPQIQTVEGAPPSV